MQNSSLRNDTVLLALAAARRPYVAHGRFATTSVADNSSTVLQGKCMLQRFGFLDLIYVITRKGVVVVETVSQVETH